MHGRVHVPSLILFRTRVIWPQSQAVHDGVFVGLRSGDALESNGGLRRGVGNPAPWVWAMVAAFVSLWVGVDVASQDMLSPQL